VSEPGENESPPESRLYSVSLDRKDSTPPLIALRGANGSIYNIRGGGRPLNDSKILEEGEGPLQRRSAVGIC